MATKKKSYTIDAWKRIRGPIQGASIQIGKLHYLPALNLEPSGFICYVELGAPTWLARHGFNTIPKKAGWNNVERIELDPEVYKGIVQAYIDCPVGHQDEDAYYFATFVISAVHEGFVDLLEPDFLSIDPELQQKKVVRVLRSNPKKYHWNWLFYEILWRQDLFDNVLEAFPVWSAEQQDLFFRCLLRFISRDIGHSQKPQLMRSCLAAACVQRFPETANVASASLMVDSLDFMNDEWGVKAFATLCDAFKIKAQSIETMELPEGFEP